MDPKMFGVITGGLGLLESFTKHELTNADRQRRNRLAIKEHHRDVAAKTLQDMVNEIKYQNFVQDSKREAQNNFRTAMWSIASNDLNLWNKTTQAGNEVAAAYAKMMGSGGGEQTGRRSKQTTSNRKAILEYGQTQARIAAELIGNRNTTILNNEMRRVAAQNSLEQSTLDQRTGKPIVGLDPTFDPDNLIPMTSPIELALNVSGSFLSGYNAYQNLKAPDKNEIKAPNEGDDYE